MCARSSSTDAAMSILTSATINHTVAAAVAAVPFHAGLTY